MANDIDTIEFSLGKNAEISSYDGSFITRGVKEKRWRASIKGGNPGKSAYLLVAASMSTQAAAEEIARDIEAKGFDTFIRPHGEIRKVGDTVRDARKYRVYIRKAFNDRESAAEFRDSIKSRQESFIAEQPLTGSTGVITLANLETGQTFESSRPLSSEAAMSPCLRSPLVRDFTGLKM